MKKEVFSISRATILTLIHKSPKTIVELQKETGLGRTTVYFHLEQLKKHKLIIEEKKSKEVGQPVYISTNKANPLTLRTIEQMEAFLNFFK